MFLDLYQEKTLYFPPFISKISSREATVYILEMDNLYYFFCFLDYEMAFQDQLPVVFFLTASDGQF